MNNNQITVAQKQSSFISKVYGWMSAGLILTGFTSLYVASSPSLIVLLFKNSWLIFGLFLIQLAMVTAISSALHRISSTTANFIFIAYSILTGITLSTIYFVYTFSSIAFVFFICSGMFASMALYGHFTKSNLSGMRAFLFMSVMGLFIFQLLRFFFTIDSTLDWIASGFGIIVFALFTAYDSQKIKNMAYEIEEEDLSKFSIYGALMLYLDFINLFIFLLRFMGRRRD